MTNAIIIDGETLDLDVTNVTLDAILDEMVENTRSVYGSHIKIAAKLNGLMSFAWYDIDHGEVSDNATVLDTHKKPLYAALRKAGHKNPSVPYGRIRDYGRNLAADLAPNGKTMADGSPLPEGEGEGAGEGANPAKRSDMLFTVEESTKLWKRTNKSDNANLTAFAADLAAAMAKHLKIDVRTIKTA
jgi:hypothetical protein